MKWEYNLDFCGKNLREAINDGGEDLDSCKATLLSLDNCYRQILKMIPQDNLGEFECQQEEVSDLLKIFDEEETLMESHLSSCGYDGYNKPLQAVNESLGTFYDLCDYYRIWVGL